MENSEIVAIEFIDRKKWFLDEENLLRAQPVEQSLSFSHEAQETRIGMA
jgi:hypothetical protein